LALGQQVLQHMPDDIEPGPGIAHRKPSGARATGLQRQKLPRLNFKLHTHFGAAQPPAVGLQLRT
jgi:hypothetical protein